MNRGPTGKHSVTIVAGERVWAFVPGPLPPRPQLALDGSLQELLEQAILALGRLNSLTTLLPDTGRFIHSEREPMPVVIRAALAHVQFETIHPFLDGNGRVGRLLVTFMLCQAGVLREPLLYLSLFFKENKREYFRKLDGVRKRGHWEDWIEFFSKA